ncbi:MAG: preprotein translocase subunit SecE [Methylophilaceae bacterium]|nr:preprotein translocase subunit SecE [Methylophilaceae bacterium]
MLNKLKLAASLLLLVGGVVGFYVLQDKALALRIVIFLVGMGAAIAVLWTTPTGQSTLGFISDSFAEAKRVVWPTKQETMQTTIAVFVLVVVMAAFLAIVDIGFSYMVQWIMGRSA